MLKFILFNLVISMALLAGPPKNGDKISSFSANDENGNLWKLKDNLNQNYLIVYFYPAALTGG